MVSEARECRWLGYEQGPIGYFTAVCSCGWKSDPYPTAGLAGTASDLHRARRTDADDPDPGSERG